MGKHTKQQSTPQELPQTVLAVAVDVPRTGASPNMPVLPLAVGSGGGTSDKESFKRTALLVEALMFPYNVLGVVWWIVLISVGAWLLSAAPPVKTTRSVIHFGSQMS